MTGDPFVDTGSLALETLKKAFPNKELSELITFVTDLYVYKWKAKINSLFLNSPITQPAYKPDRKKQETLNLYMQKLESDELEESVCRICGSKSKIFNKVGRDLFCLSGSGTFVNFHHSHGQGINLCKDCLIKLYFLPLAVMQTGGNLGFLHCQSQSSKKYWETEVISENLNKIAKNTSEGILKSEFGNPTNALFNIAVKIIEKLKDENFLDCLQFYHFTNFGASPDCSIYTLPSPVFAFMNKIINHNKVAWFVFTRRYYSIKQAKWDNKRKIWGDKKENVIEEVTYKNNKNVIFERLLSGKSILTHLRKFYKEELLLSENRLKINSLLATYYAMEVMNMQQKQIDLIKKVSNVILKIGEKEDKLKPYLAAIEGANAAFRLRAFLLKIIKANYRNDEKEPVIKLDDYVDYLFPDGQFWGEIRDMMLIYLYERMHEKNINIEDIKKEEIREIEEETITNEF